MTDNSNHYRFFGQVLMTFLGSVFRWEEETAGDDTTKLLGVQKALNLEVKEEILFK